RGIGGTILDALGLGIFAVGGDADGRAAVALAVGQIHRRFVARNQAFVRVGRRAAQGAQRLGVFQQPPDVMQRQVAQARILIDRKQRFVFLPQRLMGVHAAAVVPKKRFDNHGYGLVLL